LKEERTLRASEVFPKGESDRHREADPPRELPFLGEAKDQRILPEDHLVTFQPANLGDREIGRESKKSNRPIAASPGAFGIHGTKESFQVLRGEREDGWDGPVRAPGFISAEGIGRFASS
jgi:hypothetical protein